MTPREKFVEHVECIIYGILAATMYRDHISLLFPQSQPALTICTIDSLFLSTPDDQPGPDYDKYQSEYKNSIAVAASPMVFKNVSNEDLFVKALRAVFEIVVNMAVCDSDNDYKLRFFERVVKMEEIHDLAEVVLFMDEPEYNEGTKQETA
ncbi:hypothetical protein BCR34DRAFT_611765 [Clohesyomyces aquaticus]|uniref:Uncharacterized protein n=1 Tax=Clohesyomyces aquaticus TaxID=1231657 RepID=A0A1Y2A0U9_9PLEO|nr:hypothetical protein BCR34DRAFT_611765 [Clohesyomyces aquaticus]